MKIFDFILQKIPTGKTCSLCPFLNKNHICNLLEEKINKITLEKNINCPTELKDPDFS